MAVGQAKAVDWSLLSAPLAERILRHAFQDSSRALTQWLSMSLVCKCDLARYPTRCCAMIQDLLLFVSKSSDSLSNSRTSTLRGCRSLLREQ